MQSKEYKYLDFMPVDEIGLDVKKELKTTLPASWFESEIPPRNLVINFNADEPKEFLKPLRPNLGFNGNSFSTLAEKEASKQLTWIPGNEATKYTKDFESIFGAARFPWCAAFVRWCLKEFGLEVPLFVPEYKHSLALVETWQQMAKVRGWYTDNNGTKTPNVGDIILFDWNQRNIHAPDNDWEDHIGIFLKKESTYWKCAEGNSRNRTGIFNRNKITVQGWITIPEGLTKI